MNEIYLAEGMFRVIRDQRDAIIDCLKYDGVKTMEHYRELMGMLNALSHVEQELKGLLEKQEQLND